VFHPLTPPAGLFWIGVLVRERFHGGTHTIVRIVRQDFEDAAPSTQQHERLIHSDARQPSGEAGILLKGTEMNESLVKSLLDDIFSILSVFRYP
jgi:hypothetical protein